MSTAGTALAPRLLPRARAGRTSRLQGSDTAWALAFASPYATVLAAFVAYPVGFALWMGRSPGIYGTLFADPLYLRTLVNTVAFVGIGVNVQVFLAFVLSGFFLGPSRWVRLLLAIYLLPWALPALTAFLSIHYMLVSEWGLLDSLWRAVSGADGPLFLVSPRLAMAANILSFVWKWLPFWTLIFLAARRAIPRDIYEAAEIDGATGYRAMVHLTFPMLANIYLICTLLSAIWAVGDFTTVYFVSAGAPGRTTDVLATYGFREAYDFGYPTLGVGAMLSALPVLVPAVILLMRRIRAAGVQL